MKSVKIILPAIVAATSLIGTARATHSLSGMGWTSDGTTVPGPLVNAVSTTNEALPDGSVLAGISSLSFNAGLSATSVSVSTANPPPFAGNDKYDWYSNSETAEVVLTGLGSENAQGAFSSFEVQFNYSDTFASPSTASLTVNNVTFTAQNAAGQNDPNSGTFVFVNGVFKAASDGVTSDINGWTESGGGPAAAPEMDPASLASGLTLLAGCLAVLRAGGKRKSVGRAVYGATTGG
jgi:hypothetical protein